MALKKRGKHYYGDSQADIRDSLALYSKSNSYPVHHFADALCTCSGHVFRLAIDEDEGAAVRTCVSCDSTHPIGDSTEYLADAQLAECECPCGNAGFEITAGVSLYADSEDVRWIYLGCRCPKCGLTATYADWKNEYSGFQELLSKV